MNNKEKSHGNRSRQSIGGREGYDSSPNALRRSSSRGKSPLSSYSSKSSSYYPNSKFYNPNGNNNYSNTSFPSKRPVLLLLYSFITAEYSLFTHDPNISPTAENPIRGDTKNGQFDILRLKVRDVLDKTTKGDIGHLQDSGGAGLEGKLRRALSRYESTGGYLLCMDLTDALEDGLGLAIDNDLAQVGGYQF